MKYGQRLRAARQHRGWTQAKLAEDSRVSQSLISQLERSETATGSEYTNRLARTLKISADWLAEEIGEMLPTSYSTTDPKIVAALQIMEKLPEYGKDSAVRDLADLSQLITQAKANGAGGANG